MKSILVLILFIYSSNLIAENSYLVGFGSNDYGQLGIGTSHNLLNTNVPVQLGKDSNWVKVSFTDNFFIGLKEDGTIWVWGNKPNYDNTPLDNNYLPVQVGSDSDWKDVLSFGNGYIAIKKDGTLWSWGKNDHYNILGYEDKILEQKTPKQVGNDTDWRKISYYSYDNDYILGFKENGKVYIWGGDIKLLELHNNLGLDTTINHPQIMKEFDYVIDLKYGHSNRHSIFYIDKDSSLCYRTGNRRDTTKKYKEILYLNGYLFFKDVNNNLYNSNLNKFSYTFSESDYLNDTNRIIEFNENHEYSVFLLYNGKNYIGLKKDSTLWGAGLNYDGILPTEDYKTVYKETHFLSGTKWKGIYFDNQSNDYGYLNHKPLIYAIKSDGTLWYWGEHNTFYNNNNINNDILVDNSTNWKEIQSGANSTLGLKEDGSLWSWGNNRYGQLGQGDFKPRFVPTQIGDEYNWSEIHLKGDYCLAIKKDSTLWMWGYPGYNYQYTNFFIENYFINKPLLIEKLDDIYKLNSREYYNGDVTFLYKNNKPLIIYNYSDTLNKEILGNVEFVKLLEINNFEFIKYKLTNHYIKNVIVSSYKNDFTYFINIENEILYLTLYPFEIKSYTTLSYFTDYIDKISDYRSIYFYRESFRFLNNYGELWGWGNNSFNQLTSELKSSYNSPIKLDSNNNWKQLIPLINDKGEMYYWYHNKNNENENKKLNKANDNDDYVKHFGNFALRTLKDTPKFSISGKVEDNSNGISGIKVTCNSDTTITDEFGNYSFTGLIQGEYSIKPITKCNSYNPENTDLIINSNVTNINFELNKINNCYSVSGNVIYEDKPFYKQAISIGDTIVFTDEMGNYFVEYLKEGNYTIEPILDSMSATPENYKINLDIDKANLDFVLKDIIYPEEENDYNLDFIIKPNPIENNELKLEIISNYEEEKLLKIFLLDGNGRKKKLIFNNNISNGTNNIEIDLNAYSEGIFFLSFEYDDEKLLKKIIK